MNVKKIMKWGIILIAFLAYKELESKTPERELQYMSATVTETR